MTYFEDSESRKVAGLAKLTLVGLVYTFIYRLFFTFYPGIHTPPILTGIFVVLNILAGMAQLTFFSALYKYFATETGKKIQNAVILAVVASAISLIPPLLSLAFLSQNPSLLYLIGHVGKIAPYCPWLSALLLLLFCLMVLKNPDLRQNTVFYGAFKVGFAGWAITLAVQTLALVNYFFRGQFEWLAEIFVYNPVILAMISSTAFACLFLFYRAFVKTDVFSLHKVEYYT